ncbi:cytochrome c oxidase subunit II [Sphingomonas crocodyli]|uniref:Cytochrome aa3 subunit 2 n=1 Tax=Sphingomonas crocodyli TaxID=1979270 RepID=A0A437M5K0_9SPHN|nr:cytochrome c oxidase subunit II [Sphingomonas crocodyli]RVT93001.1 cytochrome c oxidase subunit II [Sphingomonas crocodyli]
MGRLICLVLIAALGGCNAHQSALDVFGADARAIRQIAIVLTVGAVVILLATAMLYWRAVRAPEHSLSHEQGMRLVLWVGAIGPTLILTALLLYALPTMRPRTAAPGDLVIAVDGEQFWWRVAYRAPGRPALLSANEVRLPVGRTVTFELGATDVVHSFWIPGLGGKMDMIPGRTNRLIMRAEKAGHYRGVCAEFCGLSHALMAFDVIAMEPEAFDRWLASSAEPVRPEREARGRALFDANGCGACHAIRGTAHDAAIGPDLSRFGERRTLGAGILPPTVDNIAAFLRAPQDAKPGARMPAYPQMSPADARAIALYLKALT